jgi:hypothetical protein
MESEFKYGDVINYHGESKISKCKIIGTEKGSSYWTDRGRTRLDYEYIIYDLLDLETGKSTQTVESGRFILVERSSSENEISGLHNYRIGDVVRYKNTRGNIKQATIKGFEIVDNGKYWFNGIDIETKAKVFYPIHLSAKLPNTNI